MHGLKFLDDLQELDDDHQGFGLIIKARKVCEKWDVHIFPYNYRMKTILVPLKRSRQYKRIASNRVLRRYIWRNILGSYVFVSILYFSSSSTAIGFFKPCKCILKIWRLWRGWGSQKNYSKIGGWIFLYNVAARFLTFWLFLK